jgi:hypothetical protein
MYIKRQIGFVFALVWLGACQARDYSSKTFFRSQPVNMMAGCSFFDSRPEEHLVKNVIFKDVRLEVVALYRCSQAPEKLGAYFAPTATKNTVSIGAVTERYDIFNQKIIFYDPESAYDAPLLRGTFALRPREIVRGFHANARKWLGNFYCDVAFTCAQTEHDWQIDISDAVIDPVTGLNAISFLQGGVKTGEQNPLLYGTFQDPIPSNGYEILNVVLTSGADSTIGNGGRIGLFGECTLPAAKQKYHNELFSATVGNVGHMGMGLGMRGMLPVIRGRTYTLGCFTVAKATKFFGNDEKRLTGVIYQTEVGDAASAWGQYFLSKKTTSTLYDPAINLVGPQNLVVKPGPEFSLQMGAFLEGSRGMVSLGYRAWFRGDEDVALKDVAVASSDLYNCVLATQTYKLAPHLESCRAPAVSSHTFSAECAMYVAQCSGTVHAGMNYEVAVGNAALNNFMMTFGLTVAF